MTREDYCSFEIAKLLKEKGLDTKFVFFYRTDEEGKYIHHANTLQPISYKIADDEVVAAITHQMAMKWLREEKNVFIKVEPATPFPSAYTATSFYQDQFDCFHDSKCETYEEAVEAAIKYSLENLI